MEQPEPLEVLIFQFLQRLTENDARRVAVYVEQREDAARFVAQDLFDLAEDRSNAGPCCKRDEIARCRGLCFEDETTLWGHAADCIAARQCAIRPSAEDAIFNLFDGHPPFPVTGSAAQGIAASHGFPIDVCLQG